MTKAEYFAEIKNIVIANVEDQAQRDEYVEFIDKQIEVLANRKEAAAKRAEKKRAESDALTDKIYGFITDEPISIDEILEAIDDEEVTRNKVTARLGKLVREGKVAKTSVKVEGNKRMVYSLATEDADEVEE
jgi:hypothetical protein